MTSNRTLLAALYVMCLVWFLLLALLAIGVLFVTHDAGRYSPFHERLVLGCFFLALASPGTVGMYILHRKLRRRR